MTLVDHSRPYSRSDRAPAALARVRFDWMVALLSTWLVAGAYIDQWAHRHQPELESFFTPWHGMLYSGFLAVSVSLAVPVARSLARGRDWRRSLSGAYLWSLAGIVVFLLGGVGDMLWHEAFGIEVDLEALVSPTHLLLALGAGLIVSGPLRVSWQRGDQALSMPGVLSAGLTLSVLTYFTVYAHPFVGLWGSRESGSSLGMAGIMLQTILLGGLVLMLVLRFQLLPGTLTMLLGTVALLLSFMEYTFAMLAVGVGAGVAGDLLVRWLNPGPHRPTRFRLFAFSFPALLWLGYFLALFITDGVVWTTHLWAGAIVQAGLLSWLMSYAVFPPVTSVSPERYVESSPGVVSREMAGESSLATRQSTVGLRRSASGEQETGYPEHVSPSSPLADKG